MTVDDRPNQRACMTALAPGMQVTTSAAPGLPVATESRAYTEDRPDILVIGGGPAGLSAALAASSTGADVVLIDERASLGGQYFKPLAASHRFEDENAKDRQFHDGNVLTAAVAQSAIRCILDAMVWGAFAPLEIGVVTPDRTITIIPQQLILATGALERGVPIPGWTLPGCMTTGAAQSLIRSNRVSPGQHVVVAGNGPLNLQVANELKNAGVTVMTVAETARPFSARRLAALTRMFTTNAHLAIEGLEFVWRLRNQLEFGTAVTAVHGSDRVEAVTLARLDASGYPIPGSARHLAADAVCLGYGFYPANEIPRALGCQYEFNPTLGGLQAKRGLDGISSVPNIHIVGDCAGLGGAAAAADEGYLAGLAAAASLGRTLSPMSIDERDTRRANLSRHRQFQTALWSLFAAPRLLLQLCTPETTVCRCEGISLATLRQAIAGGAETIGGLKRTTRAGMGRCQGRYCGPILADLLGDDSVTADESSLFAPRPPVRPILIGTLAREQAEE